MLGEVGMGRGICIGVLSAAIAGCSGIPDASDVSMNIHRGMSYEEVFVMAGAYEMEQEFKGGATALQFCSGKGGGTEFVIVWFVDNRVEGLTEYEQETPRGKRCGWVFEEVDWALAPDEVRAELFIQ
jgi:hypothetical protein